MGHYLSRYLAGEHIRVWSELHRLPPLTPPPEPVPLLHSLDDFPALHRQMVEDVWQVSLETMRRVRNNLETITRRLVDDGYKFYDFYEKPFSPLMEPDPSATIFADTLEREFGPLPLSLKAFITIVGDVCFLGNHPKWNLQFPPGGYSTFVFNPISAKDPQEDAIESNPQAIWYPDPLVIEFRYTRYGGSIDSVMNSHRSVFDMWDEGEIVDRYPPGLEFAADEVHKAGYSGGSPYRLVVPAKGADSSVILDVKGEMQFVDYLRYAILEWGGFPGFDKAPPGADHGVIERLKTGLISF